MPGNNYLYAGFILSLITSTILDSGNENINSVPTRNGELKSPFAVRPVQYQIRNYPDMIVPFVQRPFYLNRRPFLRFKKRRRKPMYRNILLISPPITSISSSLVTSAATTTVSSKSTPINAQSVKSTVTTLGPSTWSSTVAQLAQTSLPRTTSLRSVYTRLEDNRNPTVPNSLPPMWIQNTFPDNVLGVQYNYYDENYDDKEEMDTEELKRRANNKIACENTQSNTNKNSSVPAMKSSSRKMHRCKENKESTLEFLKKILAGLEEIRKSSSENVEDEDNKSCAVEGSWKSQSGVRLDFAMNTTGFLRINIGVLNPPNLDKGFLSPEWSMNGSVPFPHSSLVTITAYSKEEKKVAAFVGECIICGGCELISGLWMISRGASSCRDQYASIEIKGDVMRRETLTQLKREKLEERHGHNTPGYSNSTTYPMRI